MAKTGFALPPEINPLEAFSWFRDVPTDVPDIITFVCSDAYLNRPNLYPRQGTLLKVIFLQEHLLTEYDHAVIDEWEAAYLHTADDKGEGNNGIVPGVRDRMRINSTCPCGHHVSEHADRYGQCSGGLCECSEYRGRRWFREVISVIGRRGSKGHVGGIAGSYVLWHYITKGDPQGHYGVDRDKRLTCIVFAGKKEQAVANQWKDLNNYILGAPCFSRYISRPQTEKLTLFSRHDFVKVMERQMRGVVTDQDQATFEIVPKESTTLAGRGPASFIQMYDEAAHVIKGVAKSPAEDVYEAASPSLDQFGLDSFIYIPSSPWQKIGLLYDKYQQAIQFEDDGAPAYPEMLMVQLASWDLYKDWEIAHTIERAPGELPYQRLKSAVQTYDHQMQQLERANPDTFKVERRCLDPNTRVLCADLQWRPIGTLQPGQEVIGLDEHAIEGKARKMRTATVVATERSRDKAYRIVFEDGTHVVCSGNHRWFSSSGTRGGKYGNLAFRWRSLFAEPGAPGPRQSLKVGDSIRFLMEPWVPDESRGAGYLAGVYDGEGSVWSKEGSGSWVSFPQHATKNADVLALTLELLRERGFSPVLGGDKDGVETWRFNGFGEVARFVGTVGGVKMQRQAIPRLWEGRGLPKVNGIAGIKRIAQIEELPEQDLVDIETTTGTFIAEGLVSHNSHFAAVMDAYLNPDKVKAIWEPYKGQPLTMKSQGNLATVYRAHGDPSKSGAGFGFALGHVDGVDERGLPHVVFDVLHSWNPSDYEGHEVDYNEITRDLATYLDGFMPGEMTFDQFNSVATIQALQRHARKMRYPKRVQIYERTATGPLNWKTYETFKTALGLGLIHAPYFELADLELTFLQDLGGRVDHPTSGPVQTKDVADCMAIVTYELIGEQMSAFVGQMLSEVPLAAEVQGGFNPFPGHQEEAHQSLSAFGRGRGPGHGAGRRRR